MIRKALQIWKDKLAFLLEHEPTTTEPAAKFKLKKDIEEAQTRITELEASPSDLTAQRGAPSRLPKTSGDTLFGRERELAGLDELWDDPSTHLLTIVAFGGVGKTALLKHWTAQLAARNYDGADYFDWSFYSQGTRDMGSTSADPFIDAALRFFGDKATADSASGPWDKGKRLAEILATRRALLILDGLEPLQYPPGPLEGELKDTALQALLRGLAQRNAGLCVVTTRESVTDLASYRAHTAPAWSLEHLPTRAGVALLRSLGVDGPADDFDTLVDEVRGHALALNLIGRYLVRAHHGDIRRRDRIDLHRADDKLGGHAFRAIGAYEKWLGTSGEDGRRQLAILELLGLFDRPADAGCLAALRRPPIIDGLTEPIVDMDEEDWNSAIHELTTCGLALTEGDDLDAHPLVREHFAERLRTGNPKTWQAAHDRLFDHLIATTPHRPDTLNGLQPLYQAVVHGCQAGRHEQVFYRVYLERMQRGTGTGGFYTWRQLGAFSADLGAIACFFDPPWRTVVPFLPEKIRAWLLSQTAICLSSLSRLHEAAEPMRTGLSMDVEQKRWESASVGANNLSELELTLGDIDQAIASAVQAVTFADRGRDVFDRLDHRTVLADALHQAGRRDEAMACFEEAEKMLAAHQPAYPRLYSISGFRYCNLLLDAHTGVEEPYDLETACRVVEERAQGAQQAWREIFSNRPTQLIVALDQLIIGRARLTRAMYKGDKPHKAAEPIEQAVTGLRQAGVLNYLIHGLITHAHLRHALGDPDAAHADLTEAEDIATRGPMPLHLADIALMRARLFDDRDALKEARRLVDKHGYGRRLEELADLEAKAEEW